MAARAVRVRSLPSVRAARGRRRCASRRLAAARAPRERLSPVAELPALKADAGQGAGRAGAARGQASALARAASGCEEQRARAERQAAPRSRPRRERRARGASERLPNAERPGRRERSSEQAPSSRRRAPAAAAAAEGPRRRPRASRLRRLRDEARTTATRARSHRQSSPDVGGLPCSGDCRGRREGGSLLFYGARVPDGSRVSVQVAAPAVSNSARSAPASAVSRGPRGRAGSPGAARRTGRSGRTNGATVRRHRPRARRATLADLLRDGPGSADRLGCVTSRPRRGSTPPTGAGLVHQDAERRERAARRCAQLDLFGLFTLGPGRLGRRRAQDAALRTSRRRRARRAAGPASNVYSLTGVLVHALTGRPIRYERPDLAR